MRIRTITLLSAVALVGAACNPSGDAGDSTTSSSPPETTTTTIVAAPESVVLSYTLEPGATFAYEVGIDQTIDMTSTGDATALAEGEVPGEMSIGITGTTSFTHAVSAGPEPGTFEIHITGDFTNLEFSGTIDGQPVETSEIPDLAQMEPVDVVVIVDEQGNVVSGTDELGEDLLGELGGLGSLDQMAPGAGAGQFIGPPLPEGAVTVGDTWSDTIEIPTLPGNDPITTQIDSEAAGTDTVDGIEVFVIETTTSTSQIEFDLGEMLLGFMLAFLPDDATEEERAEMDALAEQLRFAISIDETVADLTTWFDHEAGYARQAEYSSTAHMVFDINVPDEATGELVAFGMEMDMAQDVTYRLTEAGNA